MNKKSGIRLRLIVWSVVAIILLWILLAGLLGNGSFGCTGFIGGVSYPNADKYKVGEFQTDSDITELEINWTAGNVKLEKTDKDYIYVEETENLDEAEKLRYLIENEKLIIQFMKSKVYLKEENLKKDLTVYIPEELIKKFNEVEIDVVSANVDIQGVWTESLGLESVSGKVEILDVTAEELSVETVSGNVMAENVSMKETTAETVSGTIQLMGVFEDIDMDTKSGELYVKSTQAIHSLDADSVSGEVRLFIPEDNGFTAEVDSVSGDFESDFEVRHKNGEYIYGNGEAEFSFNTVSGEVSVKKITE